MSPVRASLLYDAVVIALCGIVAASTHGTVRGLAIGFLLLTLIKAPYDVWQASRHR